MNILLTGGSGLIGSNLIEKLLNKGHKIRILTRETDIKHPFYHWDSKQIDAKVFQDLDGIIHLSGATISKRWTTSYKNEILKSRVDTADLLYEYVKKYSPKLKFFISASGTGYYGQITSEQIFAEDDLPCDDFLGKICVEWEKAAGQFENIGARVVCLRTSLVLAKEGNGFKLLKLPIKLGLGANLGNGKQWIPWIHLDDLTNIYLEAVENDDLKGNYNASAPEHINHATFNQSMARAMNKPFFMPNIPAFVMKSALGEMSDLVLKGSRISSEKIENTGFIFEFPALEKALKNLL